MFKSRQFSKMRAARTDRRIRFLRRLKKDRSGVTAIEFGMVAAPFFALMLAIMEVALVYFGNFVMENAVDQASRMIRTGQVQQGGLTEAQFKNQICANMVGLFDCENGLKVDVQRFDSFGGVGDGNFDPPLDGGGNLDDSGFGFDPGNGGEVVLVRVYYVWDVIANFPGGLSNMPSGGRLLTAMATFRNEPFDG